MNIAFDSVLLGILLVLSILGTITSTISYFQLRTRKVMAITILFSIFLIKSSVMAVSRLWYPIISNSIDPIILVLDICILAALFLYGFKE